MTALSVVALPAMALVTAKCHHVARYHHRERMRVASGLADTKRQLVRATATRINHAEREASSRKYLNQMKQAGLELNRVQQQAVRGVLADRLIRAEIVNTAWQIVEIEDSDGNGNRHGHEDGGGVRRASNTTPEYAPASHSANGFLSLPHPDQFTGSKVSTMKTHHIVCALLAVGFMGVATGCGKPAATQAQSEPAIRSNGDADWFRPPSDSRALVASITGQGGAEAVNEYVYFDTTASAYQSSMVEGALADLRHKIVSFTTFAPPGSRIEVFATSQTPGQPTPVFDDQVRTVKPNQRAAVDRALAAKVDDLQSKLTGHRQFKWSPIYEDLHFVADRAGASGRRSRCYAYSDLQEFSSNVTTALILRCANSPDALARKVTSTMPRLDEAPEEIVAVRWPGYVGSRPLTAADEDALKQGFDATVSAWGSHPSLTDPDSTGGGSDRRHDLDIPKE